MALQDLTPQLRTRLSRMERAVGWFVFLAVLLLAFGFIYYVYTTAERKGWFLTKAPYYTYLERATGLKEGDPVKMMGFDVGRITRITAEKPEDVHNVYVEFEIKSPFYGYLWTEDSRAEVAIADLLGKRVLEVTKGTGGYPTYIFFPLRELALAEARTLTDLPKWELAQELRDASGSNVLFRARTKLSRLDAIAAAGFTNLVVMDTREQRRSMTGLWNAFLGRFEPYSRKKTIYHLVSEESAAVTERLEGLVSQVESALPDILGLTNDLARVLGNSADLTSNLNVVALSARPIFSNLTAATAGLDRPGALGEWLLPANANRQLEGALANANGALAAANTNLATLAANLDRSLDDLSSITSNLNRQVQTNTNILSGLSTTIIDADQFVQGLKRHWLLRSAFKTRATNAPPATPAPPLHSPKEKGERR